MSADALDRYSRYLGAVCLTAMTIVLVAALATLVVVLAAIAHTFTRGRR